MAEAVVNFLCRMAFLLANDGRDADIAALRAHTLALLSDALELWPTVRCCARSLINFVCWPFFISQGFKLQCACTHGQYACTHGQWCQTL